MREKDACDICIERARKILKQNKKKTDLFNLGGCGLFCCDHIYKTEGIIKRR